jgi:hypothetical protein
MTSSKSSSEIPLTVYKGACDGVSAGCAEKYLESCGNSAIISLTENEVEIRNLRR